MQKPESYSLVYLNLMQEEIRREQNKVIFEGTLKSKRERTKRPRKSKTFYCHLSYSVFVWVPKGSHLTSQVCCRTWFCKENAVLWCRKGTGLRIRSTKLTGWLGLLQVRALLGTLPQWASCLHPNYRGNGPDNFPGSSKNEYNSRKHGISRGGRSKCEREERIWKGPKNFSGTTFCLSIVFLLP